MHSLRPDNYREVGLGEAIRTYSWLTGINNSKERVAPPPREAPSSWDGGARPTSAKARPSRALVEGLLKKKSNYSNEKKNIL